MTLQSIRTIKIISILIILLIFDQASLAQDQDLVRTDSDTQIPSYLGLETNLNDEDFLLGLAFAHRLVSWLDLRLTSSFWLRPYGKEVLNQYAENIYFVYKEELYALLLGLDKEVVISRDISLFSSAELGFVYKNYRGSNRDNLDVSVPIITAGLGYGFLSNTEKNRNQFLLRLGYQYCKMAIYPNRFYLALFVIL